MLLLPNNAQSQNSALSRIYLPLFNLSSAAHEPPLSSSRVDDLLIQHAIFHVRVRWAWGSARLLFFPINTILFAVGESKGRATIARCHTPAAMQGTLIPMAVIVDMGFVENAIGGRCRAKRVMLGNFVTDRSIASGFSSNGRPGGLVAD
jgi:hypothetical protein